MVNLSAILYHIITEKGNSPRMTAKPRPRRLIASHRDLSRIYHCQQRAFSQLGYGHFYDFASNWLPGSIGTLSIPAYHFWTPLGSNENYTTATEWVNLSGSSPEAVIMMITGASTPEEARSNCRLSSRPPRELSRHYWRHSAWRCAVVPFCVWAPYEVKNEIRSN